MWCLDLLTGDFFPSGNLSESHCFFLTGGTEASHRRVAHMERLSDGFQVSETDMALRGPGEFLGTKQAGQSGLPSLQVRFSARQVTRRAL